MMQNGYQILVVDEDPADLRFVTGCLKAEGHSVVGLLSSTAGFDVDIPASADLKLLVTAVAMWPVSGVEVAKRMASNQPNIRVLFMSGITGRAMLKRDGLDGLCWSFIEKPFTASELCARVNQLTS